MTALQHITGQYKELLDLSTDPDAELPEEALRDTLQAIEGEFEAKALKIVEVINSTGIDIAAIDAEIERLQARKKVIENREKSIREYLRENMESCEIKKISCPLFSITLAAGRDVVVIDDEDQIPEEYMRVKTSVSVDKSALLKALKDGEVLGAHLAKSKTSLRIK